MLTSVHIQRFRSCRDVTVDNLSGVTLFIGPNGAGKSNFLRAIQWAANTAIRGADAKDWFAFNSKAQVDLEFTTRERQFKYTIAAKLDDPTAQGSSLAGHRLNLSDVLLIKEGTDWKPLVARVGTDVEVLGIDSVGTCAPEQGVLTHAFLSSKPKERQLSEWDLHIYYAWSFLNKILYYPLELPQGEASYFTGTELQRWEHESPNGMGNGDLKRLTLLQRDDKEGFEEMKALLGPDTLAILNDIDIRVLTPQVTGQDQEGATMYFPGFQPANFHVGTLVPYEDLSFGTKRLLSLVLALVADEASVMLIEQPEDGIHPGLLKRLLAVLKSYADPRQFFLTSHSPAVINVLTPKDIRLVEMSGGITTVRPLNEDELEQAHTYVATEGALYDFIKSLES